MILFVDDEPFFVDTYVTALTDGGYEVSLQKKVGAAMKIFEGPDAHIELVITDVMMTAGTAFAPEEAPQSDLTTGFAFYDWIRRRAPKLPVVILTNKTSPDVDEKFGSEENCWVFRKGPRCSPSKLVQHVNEVLETAK
jgi:CheY-like chemotaxis protein